MEYYLKNIVPRFKYVLLTNDELNRGDRPRPDIGYGGHSPLDLHKYGPKQLLLETVYQYQTPLFKKTYIIPKLPVTVEKEVQSNLTKLA